MWGVSVAELGLGLRVLEQVAVVGGGLRDKHRELFAAITRHSGFDAESIARELAAREVVTAVEVAENIPDAVSRIRLVQAMIVVAVIDGTVTCAELDMIRRYATVLGVDDPRIHNLAQLLSGRTLRLKLDALRRYPLLRESVERGWKHEGLRGLWKTARWFVRLDRNPRLAGRYRALRRLPKDTLGYGFWSHMQRHGFAFPGEPGGMPEQAVHHDLTHVLTGYGTDQAGELELQAFYAGCKKSDPFAFIFSSLLMGHLGIGFLPVAAATKGQFDADRTLRALRRGSKITFDPTIAWDYWSDMERSVDGLRESYGIGPVHA